MFGLGIVQGVTSLLKHSFDFGSRKITSSHIGSFI
jgi:hypothetical protein